MSHSGTNSRMPCPVCGRLTAVSRNTEQLRAHKAAGVRCPGSDTFMNLYSAPTPTPEEN